MKFLLMMLSLGLAGRAFAAPRVWQVTCSSGDVKAVFCGREANPREKPLGFVMVGCAKGEPASLQLTTSGQTEKFDVGNQIEGQLFEDGLSLFAYLIPNADAVGAFLISVRTTGGEHSKLEVQLGRERSYAFTDATCSMN